MVYSFSVDWMWLGIGFISGVFCSWFVADLVFDNNTSSIRYKDNNDE